MSHFRSALRRARPRYLRCMYDAYGACTPSRCVSTLIHGWLGPADTRAWLRIFEQEVDSRQPTDGRGCREKWRGDRLEMYGHGRLPTLTDAYRRLPTLIPGAGLLLLPRVTVSIRTPVWLGLNATLLVHPDLSAQLNITCDPSGDFVLVGVLQ